MASGFVKREVTDPPTLLFQAMPLSPILTSLCKWPEGECGCTSSAISMYSRCSIVQRAIRPSTEVAQMGGSSQDLVGRYSLKLLAYERLNIHISADGKTKIKHNRYLAHLD